jgi:anti-sigma-K factor RskA
MNSNHPNDLLPGFALGCLDESEKEQVHRHLSTCAKCQAEVAGYGRVVDHLALGAIPAAPPASLRRNLLNNLPPKIASRSWVESIVRAWPRLAPISAVCGLVLIVILAASNVILWHHRMLEHRSVLLDSQVVTLRATPSAPGASGLLVMSPDAGTALLVVSNLPSLAADRQYQLWLIKDGHRTSGGIFSVSQTGDGRLEVTAASPINSFDAFGITIEPFGGSSAPTGSKVLGGAQRS